MRMLKQAIGLSMGLLLSGCSIFGGSSEVEPDSVIIGVNYIGASVSDLERTGKLYRDAVDLQSVDQSVITEDALFDKLAGRTGVEAQTQMMRSVNAQVRFMNFANPSKEAMAAGSVDVHGPGIAHVCYQVNQTTNAYQKFLTGGAKHIGAKEMVQIRASNPVHYAYARDFDNLIAEIEEVDVTKLDLTKPPENDYRIRHVSLATTDMDRIVKFYSTFLGGQEARRAGNWFGLSGESTDKISGHKDAEIEMAWFQVRNLELELIQYYNPKPEPLAKPRPIDALGYNMIVFGVSDMEAARKRLIDAGGSVVSEPEAMDGGQIMFGRDPDGNLIGLQVVAKGSVFSSKNFKNNGI